VIGVDRGDEPEALVLERERQLARAELRGRLPGREDIKGYDPPAVRQQLCAQQHEKCAYCEKGIEQEAYPIEHFRPKLGGQDVQWDQRQGEEPPLDLKEVVWAKDPAPYWWLAWTWENLFYSCPTCNSQKYKANRFPLRQGSPRLLKMSLPAVAEQALLLNPADVDPFDHIRFVPDREENNWRAIGLTLEGRWTILVLGLNRTGLRTNRKKHVKTLKENYSLKHATDALGAGDAEALQVYWRDAVATLLAPEQDYLALTRCVLDDSFPAEVRERYGLDLPRPSFAARRIQHPLLRCRPDLAGLSRNLEMRLRALGERTESAELDELLVALCRERSCMLEELCALLRLGAQYLQQSYLTRLCGGDRPMLRLDPTTGRYCGT